MRPFSTEIEGTPVAGPSICKTLYTSVQGGIGGLSEVAAANRDRIVATYCDADDGSEMGR